MRSVGSATPLVLVADDMRAAGFTGPIVAASGLDEYRRLMVYAGCSHEAPKQTAAQVMADALSKP